MDALDRKIAAALQVNGRATWRQIAQAVGASESTVARRAQQLLDTQVVRVTGVPDPLRCGLGYPVLVRLSCEVGAAADVAERLAERPDVRSLTLVTGSFDIFMELIVPSRRHLARVLVDELPTVGGITHTRTDGVLRTYKISFDWSRALLGEGYELLASNAQAAHDEGAGGAVQLDDVDLRLIQLLAADGRCSFHDLAGAVGITESTARRRVESMSAKGALKFGTLLDPLALGYDVEILAWFDVDMARLEETAAALAARPEVRYLSATVGASDLVAEIIQWSYDDLYELQANVLGALPGLRDAELVVELDTIKRAYLRMGNYVWRSSDV